MPGLTKPIVYEQGDRLYLVAPVSPSSPTEADIEHFAFASDLKKTAPNPNIAWFSGHYVSGDTPNLNGVGWTSGELAIKKLTPMFMPVTVMHDPRTAVGLIADVKLSMPGETAVARPKIDTALALWKHRFPDVVHEAEQNYAAGTLMQSMECLAPDYECSDCGMVFHKLPQGAERANWCSHLRAMDEAGGDRTLGPSAFRVLRNVTFTGTGLIFGTRGAQGADPEAHLETFTAEVAEFHQRVHRDQGPRRRKRAMEDITIPKSEYDELRARPSRTELDDVKAQLAEAEKAVEEAEAAKAKVEQERDSEKAAREQAEEKARRSELRDERIGALGDGFTAKLGEKTKARLTDQAGVLADDEWSARLEELEEAYDVKRDEGAEDKGGNGDREFSREEVARSAVGQRRENGGNGGDVNPAARRSVMRGLVKPAK